MWTGASWVDPDGTVRIRKDVIFGSCFSHLSWGNLQIRRFQCWGQEMEGGNENRQSQDYVWSIANVPVSSFLAPPIAHLESVSRNWTASCGSLLRDKW